MIRVTPSITIHEKEIRFEFIRASGPGGQNVNKVSTAVQLRFDVAGSGALPPEVKARLTRLAGKRISAAGELVIDARRYRSQERNRQDAVDRLVALIRRAARKPMVRRKTRPTAASKEQRLEEKRRRSETKRRRRRVPSNED
jgi:ribosome-associated protein